MSMKICEAYGDENGKGSGGKPGDQTGRELSYRAWYKRTRGWNYVLIPKNAEIGRKAANLAIDIVKSRLFGYDKGDRWTILTSRGRFSAEESIFTAFIAKCTRRSLI